MSETWTTEYPTKPGYYWIRRFYVHGWLGMTDGPLIAQIWPDGVLDFIGHDRGYSERNIISAEWFGPIEPPRENCYRRGVVPVTLCASCDKGGELLTYEARGTDGFYHSAVICRECYERRLSPPQFDAKAAVDTLLRENPNMLEPQSGLTEPPEWKFK